MKAEKIAIYVVDPSDKKILNELIELDKKAQKIKDEIGIIAYFESTKSMQMRKEYFLKMFPNHEIDENWDMDYERRSFFIEDYEFFTLIPKEREVGENA